MIAFSTLSIVSLLVSVSYSIPPPSLIGRAAFTLSNGHEAQAQNAIFATLKSTDPCNDGEIGCVDNGQFAQCVGGTWQVTGCSGGTQCVALPLVNKAGISVTCDTLADAEARIATTGATGGLTGDGSGSTSDSTSGNGSGSESSKVSTTTTTTAVPQSTPTSQSTSSTSSSSSGGFALDNGKAAQKLNAEFATLTASSDCTTGNACVDGKFAQCVGGSFVLQACAGGLQCYALPLVNSPGTSITCTTEADALARIQRTGASGGIDG